MTRCWVAAWVLASWQGAAAASVWDGIYTDQQAERGAAGYREACASCHGEKLKGHGQNPPLAGDSFTANWNGSSVGDLLEKIQVSMPADRPGKLSKAQNAEILAYILKFNKFPGGDKDLPADSDALKAVRFEAAKP
jgi:S-disulfanyl-L-cysteine oxidoreductase SoxD